MSAYTEADGAKTAKSLGDAVRNSSTYALK
jgi:hypothetical protein